MLNTTTLGQLDQRFDELFKAVGAVELNLLTAKVSMNPNLQKGVELNFFRFRGNLSLRDKLFLGVLVWYIPDEIRVLAQLWLEEHWGGERKEWIAVLTTSKLTALGLLLVQDELGDNDVWGNYLTERYFKLLIAKFPKTLKRQRPKARALVRRRGHRDSAGGREYHGPNRIDFSKIISEEEVFLRRSLLEQKIETLRHQIDDRLSYEITRRGKEKEK